jgi:hypothetical protein
MGTQGVIGQLKQKFFHFLKEPWIILASWFIFVMFLVIVLPAVAYRTAELGVTPSIDTNFAFDPQSIYPILEGYGVAGRAYYLQQRWRFDLVWPLLYGLPLWLTSHRFMGALPNVNLKWLNLTPLLAILFDYLENIVFSLMVLLYPNQILLLAYIGVSFSLMKWLFLGVAMMLTMCLSLVVLVKYLRSWFR